MTGKWTKVVVKGAATFPPAKTGGIKRKRQPMRNRTPYKKRKMIGSGSYNWGLGASTGHVAYNSKTGWTAQTPSIYAGLQGSGDYHGNLESIRTNSIVNPRPGPPPISSGQNGHGGIVIRRREFLQDVVSSASANTFKIDTFSLNPGQSETFPWLSNLAESYEQYRIRGLIFQFVSLSADATASVATSLGYVAMSTQYDVLDAPFSTKQEMENYDMAQSCKPSRSQIHGVECAPKQSVLHELYVRPGDAPPTSDLRMYDFGNFSIASSAPGTLVTLGELWVSYDIELFKPKMPNTVTGNLDTLHLVRNNTTGTSPAYGLIDVQSAGSIQWNASNTVLSLTNMVIGTQYMFKYQLSAPGTTITTLPTFTITAGGTAITYFSNNGANTAVGNNVGTGAAISSNYFTFKVTNQTVQITNTVLGVLAASAAQWMDVFVMQLDSTVNK